MSEVTDALDALQRGERTLEQVQEFFLTRHWPRPSGRRDTGARSEGSFTEVADAYSNGSLSLDQYVVLAEAASTAMKQQQKAKRPTTDEVNP